MEQMRGEDRPSSQAHERASASMGGRDRKQADLFTPQSSAGARSKAWDGETVVRGRIPLADIRTRRYAR